MTQVYVAVGVDPTEKYHESKDCHSGGKLVKADKSELPKSATPCTFCAGGISAEELRQRGGEKA
jgi:hypothetical protein